MLLVLNETNIVCLLAATVAIAASRPDRATCSTGASGSVTIIQQMDGCGLHTTLLCNCGRILDSNIDLNICVESLDSISILSVALSGVEGRDHISTLGSAIGNARGSALGTALGIALGRGTLDSALSSALCHRLLPPARSSVGSARGSALGTALGIALGRPLRSTHSASTLA